MFMQAMYIWQDGTQPSQQLRCKVKIIHKKEKTLTLADCPEWSFDGSSTGQASGTNSDLVLKPVALRVAPQGIGTDYLVLCEVFNADSTTPHETNHRYNLRQLITPDVSKLKPWIGFEQEYTLFSTMPGVKSLPLGWPKEGEPRAQGPFYCGVGADEAYGRPLVDAHARACLDIGLMYAGNNAEVMPGQWEFQIGLRGILDEEPEPLRVCDDLIFARWLLFRMGEEHNIAATLHPKPMKGNWNGAGKHTNFSTTLTRDKKNGLKAIEDAIKKLANKHEQHIQVYGAYLDERLTGDHETANITDFTYGVAHRGASIRIPLSVHLNGHGYFEDRRPGANANPYDVASALIDTVCI